MELEPDPIERDLNPVQKEAVLFGDGPLLVLAGAGSGKTRVLTRRIVHLILRRGLPPDRILAVTFTNKAAGEMRSRVEAMLGFDAAGLWIGTFHSICLRLLRRHADRLGFDRGITVFDADDQISLLRQVLKEEAGHDADAPKVRELATIISLAKNRMWEPDDLAHHLPRPDRERLAHFYRRYQEKLRAQGGADFDDLLVLAVRLIENHPDLGDRYARKFEHILVDEYQDTNHIQFRLVRRLAEGHGNIMVVGDDDQSIYGWRGADLSNILEFEKRFKKAVVLRMTQNYRSTGSILEVANAVVKNNRSRLEKSLWTENEEGRRPAFFVADDEEDEARRIVQGIQREARDGRLRPGEVAILYRVHALSRPLEEACLNFGLPYALVGGVVFYQRKEIKDLLAYLRLVVNPFDSVSFARALSWPSRGIGNVGLARITEAAAASSGDLVRAAAGLTAEAGLRGRAIEKVREFGTLVLELADRAARGPEPLLRTVCERTAFFDRLKESGEPGWEDRVANVLELLDGAGRFQEREGEGSLQAWLDQVALYTSLDTRVPSEERITLMTVHNAKGLEWPHVYIAGLEEGLFPHASAFDDPAEMEEERRLFYVAATRARQSLTLSASEERRRLNWTSLGGLSRFLLEIPPELLDEDKTIRRWMQAERAAGPIASQRWGGAGRRPDAASRSQGEFGRSQGSSGRSPGSSGRSPGSSGRWQEGRQGIGGGRHGAPGAGSPRDDSEDDENNDWRESGTENDDTQDRSDESGRPIRGGDDSGRPARGSRGESGLTARGGDSGRAGRGESGLAARRGDDDSGRAGPGRKLRWTGHDVEHVLFGIGRVEAQEGDGPEARLLVIFPGFGAKKIVARFVRRIP